MDCSGSNDAARTSGENDRWLAGTSDEEGVPVANRRAGPSHRHHASRRATLRAGGSGRLPASAQRLQDLRPERCRASP